MSQTIKDHAYHMLWSNDCVEGVGVGGWVGGGEPPGSTPEIDDGVVRYGMVRKIMLTGKTQNNYYSSLNY